ncbi:hypothetical protein DFH08DRAFT_977306 [Mycena albidolilacea]|uniref:Ribonuclease H1 N-terminal domain-containing protein n=1 Tax=Mycena albidolilacea TaxID=1033008 RepID=A0AAD7E8U7_9AGAR|nr:hypothetical protein DFH08DRAFT_978995 [Mycena albidolilacea]KAJ7303091.1 hypothetical protein DFH08DRAFT_977306 [Mycena albidolilacea]
MVNTNLETAFSQLQLAKEDFFHPREGYEWTRGVEDHWFYVVSVGHIPGIYTHWEETSQQSAYEILAQLPKATSPMCATRRSKNAASICPPSTPPPARHPQPKAETRVSLAATARTGVQTDPSTPTGSPKKLMYVYSRDDGSTIYADPREASSAARRGLADGSFRRVDVTPHVHDAFNHATESALDVYYISSDDE